MNRGDQLDRYIVEDVIGRGGMAVVYRVRHATLDSVHALKVLHTDQPLVAERLLQEGRLQASINHPNVVRVTDVIRVDDAPGLVMEYLPEGSLEALIGQLPHAEVIRIFTEVLAGVAYAHALGMVHRDLKPANILLQNVDGQQIPKVADFGLAKALAPTAASPRLTQSGVAIGTPAFMAPEQIHNARSVDQRADIWALGVILYELSSGERLFEGANALEVLNAVVKGPPPGRLAGLSEPVRSAVRRACEPILNRRLPDCDALRRVLLGQSNEEVGTSTWSGVSGTLTFDETLLPPEDTPQHTQEPLLFAAETLPDPVPSTDPSVGPPDSSPVSALTSTEEPSLPDAHAGTGSTLAASIRNGNALDGRTALRTTTIAIPVFFAFTALLAPVDAVLQYPMLRTIRGALPITDVVIIPEVETDSIPAKRAAYAALLPRLQEAGARAVAFDVHFRAETDADDTLINAMKSVRAKGMHVIANRRIRESAPIPFETPALALAFTPALSELQQDLIFGTIRRVRIRRRLLDGPTYWSLAVEAAAAHMGNPPIRIDNEELIIGGLRNPVHADVAYLHPTLPPPVIDPLDLTPVHGKLVFIGRHADADDLYRSPDGPRHGVAILASFTQTLLRQETLRPSRPELDALLTMIAGLGTALLGSRLDRSAQPLALLSTLSVIAIAGALLWSGQLLSICPPILASLLGLWAVRKSSRSERRSQP